MLNTIFYTIPLLTYLYINRHTVLWISGFIYGKVKTKLNKFITNKKFSKKIYMVDFPNEYPNDLIEINEYNLCNSHVYSNAFYVVATLQPENIEKVLIFKDKNILISKLNDLENLIKENREKFSEYMEVNVKKKNGELIDISNYFLKYTSINGFFNIITETEITPAHLYDFNNKRFILGFDDKLDVLKMDFSNKTFDYLEKIN